MKSLRPTLRENKRYLLIKCKNSKQVVERVILDFIGILGYAESGVTFIEADSEKAIVAVNREALNRVRAAFAVSPEKLQVLKVSGTLKGLREK